MITGFQNANDGINYCKTNPSDICCTATSNVVPSSTDSSTQQTKSLPTEIPPSIDPNVSAGAPTQTTTKSTSDSTSASSASTSEGQNGGISPLVIGAGALGVALLAVLAGILVFIKKGTVQDRKSQLSSRNSKSQFRTSEGNIFNQPPSVAPKGGANNGVETMECVFEYKSNLFDELSLSKQYYSYQN